MARLEPLVWLWLVLPVAHALALSKKGFGAPRRTPKKTTKRATGGASSSPEVEAAMALLGARRAFEARIAARAPDVARGLGPGADGAVAVLDDLLGADACAALRREAARVHRGKLAAGAAGVASTRAELLDPEDFARCPRVVALSLALAAGLRAALPRADALSADCAANMLSCYAAGGAFPVHVDNHGGDDRRAYGAIYYMNPDLDAAAGGEFVPWRRTRAVDGALDAADLAPAAPIAPRGDRLIVFEADTLAHSVNAYADDAYRRYALTVWVVAADGADLGAVLRPDRRALSPTATHAGMADAERDKAA